DLNWTQHFLPVSRRATRTADEVCQVVATIMAYGCNLGPETMARLTNDVTYADIQRITDWYLHEDALRAALADLVNAIAALDTTQVWGDGRASSSDGQRFLFPRRVLRRTYSHRLGDYAWSSIPSSPTITRRSIASPLSAPSAMRPTSSTGCSITSRTWILRNITRIRTAI